MTKYEMTFLFAKDNKTQAAKLEKYLKEAKAENVKKEDWGVKSLAYPISKQQEAHYLYFEAEVETEQLIALEKKIQLDDAIMRHLIVKQ